MITRAIQEKLIGALQAMPVVALLGPRQVGKTTLALTLGEQLDKQWSYLDLESDSDFNKFDDAEGFLSKFDGKLLILDEVQRKPDLFRIIRGIVDARKRKGEKACLFLLLGSASPTLLQGTAESLAGRIRYLEMCPFTSTELYWHDSATYSQDLLWLRGGFPDSYLAASELDSLNWRLDFISTFVERDLPNMGAGISALHFKRFWRMLAHYHANQVNYSELGRSLELSHTTVKHYLDTLTGFYMVRQLEPYAANVKKRLVKSPKIYLRDSGILHSLLNLPSMNALLGHPALGGSWEGFVVENIVSQLDSRWNYYYYRTATQVEIDLILITPTREVWAVEIKRNSAPKLGRGFFEACEDVNADRKFVVYALEDSYPLKNNVQVIGLRAFLKLLSEQV